MALCDASTLPGAATCFACKVPKGFRAALNLTYLVRYTGYQGTPQSLLDKSNAYQEITGDMILAAKVWLAATHSGNSTDPNTLLSLANCYLSCIANGDYGDIESYLYALNASNSMDPATEFAAASAYQLLRGSEWRAELWLLDNLDGTTSPDAALAGAKCLLNCLSPGMLKAIYLYLLCQGLGSNLIPVGSMYAGATPSFSLAITANSYYKITWGSNEVSATVCGTSYPSAGAKNTTIFYSGPCTLLELFGNAAGTSVTAVLIAEHNVETAPSGFTFLLTSSTVVTATWDTPPAAPANNPYVVSTELWTSTDGVTYALASTVAAPATSTTVTAPTLGNNLYGKARWIYSDGGNGGFSPAYEVFGAVTNWASRVVTNGGAAVSAATMQAVNTFYNSINAAGLISKMKAVCLVTPGGTVEMRTPLIKTFGSDPWGLLGTGSLSVNGWHQNGGGTNGLFTTGVLPSLCFASDTVGGLSVYVFATTNADSSSVDIGAQNGSTQTCQLYTNFGGSPGSAFVQIYNNTAGSAGGTSQGAGFYSGNVRALNDESLYYGSSAGFQVLRDKTSGGGGTRPAFQIYAGGLNNAGATSGAGARTYSYYSIHDGFTQAEAQAEFNAVQALRVALGGGFV